MHKSSVMIVEDEGLIANDIAFQLGCSGYGVDAIASSGEEALGLLETSASHPDLVLMDIRLKGPLDGIETALRVRSHYRLPVIFLTSHADSETLARAKHAEPSGYLVKPFRQVNLCSAIEMAIFKHKSELALRDREAWLSSVLHSTADPTIVVDTNGVVQFLNPSAEKLLQYDLATAVNSKWSSVMPLFDRDGQPLVEIFNKTTPPHEIVKLASGTFIRRPDQTEVAVEGHISSSFSAEVLTGFIVNIRDISIRLEQEARLRFDQKMVALGRLAGGIAHDFNKVLTVVIGHISLLAGETAHEDRHDRLSKVLEAAYTGVDLTKQLLSMSGNLLVEPEVISINDRIDRMIGWIGSTLGPRVSCLTDLDPETGKTKMNPAHFDQIAMNLVINARDAMPGGGTIRISTSNLVELVAGESGDALQHFVQLVVADSGTGIPPEVKEHLFEPFFTTKTMGKGSGLGLSIVYGIVQELGGKITVESKPGCGASFSVLLPRVEEIPANNLGLTLAVTADQTTGKTLLLADDDDIVRDLLQGYLEDQGFQVIVAGNGQEALNTADMYDGDIDVLLSDIRMPKMDGVTLSKQIHLSRPQTKILLMSGCKGDSITTSEMTDSPVVFIQKPFLLPDLLHTIHFLNK